MRLFTQGGSLMRSGSFAAVLLLAIAPASFAQQSFVISGHIVKPGTLLPPSSLCADCRVGAQVIATVQHSGPKVWDTPDTKVWSLNKQDGNGLTVQIGGTSWSTDSGFADGSGTYKDGSGFGTFSFQPPSLMQSAIFIGSHLYDTDQTMVGYVSLQAEKNPATARFTIGGAIPGQPPPARYMLVIAVDGMTDGQQQFTPCPVPPPALPVPAQQVNSALLPYFVFVDQVDSAIADLARKIKATVEDATLAVLQNQLENLTKNKQQCTSTWDPILKSEGRGTEGRTKPINLPSAKNIQIKMGHIISNHTVNGDGVKAALRAGGSKKDLFPAAWSNDKIEQAIREAYSNCKLLSTQEDTALVEGQGGGLTIQMWVNKATRTIETAYPQ